MQLLNNLQRHLINSLRPLLRDELTGIYSFVPFDAKYPFVRIAEMHAAPWKQAAQPAFIIENKITIYSNDKSNKPALSIAGKVQSNILQNKFNDDFYTVIKCLIDEVQIKQSADLKVWQVELKLINWVVQHA